MKIEGWICIVIGGLSFFGAAIYGDSVMGAGLGIFLIYQINQKIGTERQRGLGK